MNCGVTSPAAARNARLRVDPGYERARKKLSPELQARADRTLEKFLEDPKRPGLNLKSLSGAPGYFSIRVSRGYRILLRREEGRTGEVFAAVDVGPHDVYRRR